MGRLLQRISSRYYSPNFCFLVFHPNFPLLWGLLEKYLTVFGENLVDLNEVRLHEATLNLNTPGWIFSRLQIALVDGN